MGRKLYIVWGVFVDIEQGLGWGVENIVICLTRFSLILLLYCHGFLLL